MGRCIDLTVNPDEDAPYQFDEVFSWVLYKVFMPKARELEISLKKDSAPFGAPLDYIPNKSENGDYSAQSLLHGPLTRNLTFSPSSPITWAAERESAGHSIGLNLIKRL